MKASTSLAIFIVVESALCSIEIKLYRSAAIMITDINITLRDFFKLVTLQDAVVSSETLLSVRRSGLGSASADTPLPQDIHNCYDHAESGLYHRNHQSYEPRLRVNMDKQRVDIK